MSLQQDIKNKLALIFGNTYKKIGYSIIDIRKIKALDSNNLNSYLFYGNKIYFKNPVELLHNLSEIFIHEIYKINLPLKSLIIDCGSNIGVSVLYFKKNFPESTVIAFEPDNHNFEILSLNVASYKLKGVELNNTAVWIEDTYLNFSNDNSMSSKIENDNKSPSNSKVKAIRLYDLITQQVDLLKIDIEGAEYKILVDIESKLHLIRNIFFEYHGNFAQIHELTNIFTILNNNGFKYYIKEATEVYRHPFLRTEKNLAYDIQLNIFCFRG